MTYKFRKLMDECAKRAGVHVERIESGSSHYKVYVRGRYPAMVTVSVSPNGGGQRFAQNVITSMRRMTSQPQRGIK